MTQPDRIIEPPPGVVLMGDPRVAAIPIVESGEPMADLARIEAIRTESRRHSQAGVRCLVREEVARRLTAAVETLPDGLTFLVVDGYRAPAVQQRLFDRYVDKLALAHPDRSPDEVRTLASRFTAPPEGAPPHTTGGAVDITLCDSAGRELDMGSPVDANPEESQGRCFTAAADLSPDQRRNRDLLIETLTTAGFANYPTEWWHWSLGDRYWCLMTNGTAARYGTRYVD
ncbi:M15 family metallopeptidase [Pseudonocardia acaciae]|uniref:M15 family metallopeptidase n=1 Tax=Pseudonocardia acaciae TaxID=551276 RepID=UPI000A05B4DB|nr:M15 family metallopeptidase [Pseudonocardia acaciae]